MLSIDFFDYHQVEDPEYGYLEPVVITEGKLSLRLALEMINLHKDDPKVNSASILAEKYNLDVQTTKNILEYFQPFNLILPKAEDVVKERNPIPLLKSYNLRDAQKRLDNAQKLIDEYSSRTKT